MSFVAIVTPQKNKLVKMHRQERTGTIPLGSIHCMTNPSEVHERPLPAVRDSGLSFNMQC